MAAPPPFTDKEEAFARIQVIDLASIAQPDSKRLAVSALLDIEFTRLRREWYRSTSTVAEDDLRVPTFVVLDEAHNLVPSEAEEPIKAALREQFRTIAAEGRKFGLFLVLVSQRPDKLDNLVVSECRNRVLMRLGSRAVLASSARLLGLEDLPARTLEKCLEFDSGRGLMFGPWTEAEPTFFYCAARRTQEGGRDLRAEFWATPDNE